MGAVLAEDVAHESGVTFGNELHAVIGDDSRRLLAAVLQGMQSQHRQRARIGMAEDSEHAAFFVETVVEGRFVVVAGHCLVSPFPVASMSLSSARRSSAP